MKYEATLKSDRTIVLDHPSGLPASMISLVFLDLILSLITERPR